MEQNIALTKVISDLNGERSEIAWTSGQTVPTTNLTCDHDQMSDLRWSYL